MHKRSAKAAGYALGRLRAEVRGDQIVSEGSVYVDGHHGQHQRRYVMTTRRLVFGPLHWLPEDQGTEDFPIVVIEFGDVLSFRIVQEATMPVVEVALPGRTIKVSVFYPGGTYGRQDWKRESERLRDLFCRSLSAAGAESA